MKKEAFASFWFWCTRRDSNASFCATCRCCAEHTHLGSSFWLKRINQNPWWATSIKNLLAVFYLKNLNQFATPLLSLKIFCLSNFCGAWQCQESNLLCAKKMPTHLRELFFGAPGEIRTPDRSVRSRVLYPAELRVHVHLISYHQPLLLSTFYFIIFWKF